MINRKESNFVRVLTFVMGLIFVCGGLYFLIDGIHSYINQLRQKDWKSATAVVINVEEYHTGHKSHSIRYNIMYQYETENDIYTGKIYRTASPKNLGDMLEIKYNPLSPNQSTTYINPNFKIIISGCIAFLIYGFIGFCMIRSALLKKSLWQLFTAKSRYWLKIE